jgi:hypothetical protein
VKRTVAASRVPGMAKQLRSGVFLVVFFVFSAWSLRVALVNFDTLSALTLASMLNEVVRAVIFVGPVFLYLRYVEKVPVLVFLRISRPHASFARVIPLAGTLFVVWYVLLDQRRRGRDTRRRCSRRSPVYDPVPGDAGRSNLLGDSS